MKHDNPSATTTLPAIVRDLSQDEMEILSAWRDAGYEVCSDRLSARLKTTEQKRGGWAALDADKWHANSRARQCAIFCLAIARGKTHAEACRESGFADYREWFSAAHYTIWAKIYDQARETALAIVSETAMQRLLSNLADGEDKGTKAAVYLLDWWRAKTGLKRTDESAKAVNQSGIIYNINLTAPTPPVLPSEPAQQVIDVG